MNCKVPTSHQLPNHPGAFLSALSKLSLDGTWLCTASVLRKAQQWWSLKGRPQAARSLAQAWALALTCTVSSYEMQGSI